MTVLFSFHCVPVWNLAMHKWKLQYAVFSYADLYIVLAYANEHVVSFLKQLLNLRPLRK